jgi:uncharacterized protein
VKLLLLAVICVLLIANASIAASLSGGWKGTWTKDGDALPVTVTFATTAGGFSGTFDSDSLQVTGIPFSKVTDTGGKIHLELKGDQSTTVFDGTLAADAITGTFVDGQSKGTFQLTRFDLPAASVQSREVTFADGDVKLAGTLLLPADAGKHPAILFLHGSGPEGRWANHYLARKCAEAGIAALIYDKRGVGQSTGDWQKVGFEPLAEDAFAGIRFLQSSPEIDAAQVGIYGHSQGGTIAPLVATRAPGLAFVIASAAGGTTPADMETYSVGNSVNLSKLPPLEQKDAQGYIHALVDVAYRGKHRAELDAMAARFKSRDWFFDPPPPSHSYWAISRQIAAFEPARWWRQVKAPVLLIYAAHDERVDPTVNARAIQAALRSGGNDRVTLKMFPDSDHTFTIIDPAKKGGWPKREPDYSSTVLHWVRSAAPAASARSH